MNKDFLPPNREHIFTLRRLDNEDIEIKVTIKAGSETLILTGEQAKNFLEQMKQLIGQ